MSATPDGGDADNRPWEQPGAFRLDCEPHRAELLWWLGMASLVLGVVSVCSLLPSLLGLPLGVAVWLLARNDLRQMRAGRMDPRGEGRTDGARGNAIAGVALNLLGLTILLVLLVSSLL